MNKHKIGDVLLGQVRPTLDDIHELYCQHAAIVGFSVRLSKNRKKVHQWCIRSTMSVLLKGKGILKTKKNRERIIQI